MQAETKSTDLDRLLEIELVDIPRVRAAFSVWIDEGLLGARMRELEAEADALRDALEIAPRAARGYDGARWLG